MTDLRGPSKRVREDGCIFCDIVAGDAPARQVADGILNLGIYPLNPVTEGHFLVIPKNHVTDALASPGAAAGAVGDAAQWAWLMSERDPRYTSVNIITSVGKPATQTVFHLHVHVVPRTEGDGLALPWTNQLRGVAHER